MTRGKLTTSVHGMIACFKKIHGWMCRRTWYHHLHVFIRASNASLATLNASAARAHDRCLSGCTKSDSRRNALRTSSWLADADTRSTAAGRTPGGSDAQARTRVTSHVPVLAWASSCSSFFSLACAMVAAGMSACVVKWLPVFCTYITAGYCSTIKPGTSHLLQKGLEDKHRTAFQVWRLTGRVSPLRHSLPRCTACGARSAHCTCSTFARLLWFPLRLGTWLLGPPLQKLVKRRHTHATALASGSGWWVTRARDLGVAARHHSVVL